MFVWLVAGSMSMLDAVTYVVLASQLPRSGGEYAFLQFTPG
jgi:amino acid transporter